MAHVANVTIDHTKVSADLTDYVVYVNLNHMPAGFWSTVADGGGDIRVYKSDGTTELAREVVSCVQASDTGEIHVKYSGTLSSSVDTVIQIHADGTSSEPAVGATYGRNAVWTGYRNVLHLQSDVTDSTGNSTFTNNGSLAFNTTSTKIGTQSADFDGTDDYISLASVDAGTTLSVSWWHDFDLAAANNVRTIWSLGTDASSKSTGTGRYWRSDNDWEFDSYTGVAYTGTLDQATTQNTWTHMVTQGTTNKHEFFVDGTLPAGNSNAAALPDIASTNLRIGYGDGSRLAGYFDGQMDEFRVSNSLLSSAWVATEYANQNAPATFYATEAVSTGSPSSSVSPSVSPSSSNSPSLSPSASLSPSSSNSPSLSPSSSNSPSLSQSSSNSPSLSPSSSNSPSLSPSASLSPSSSQSSSESSSSSPSEGISESPSISPSSSNSPSLSPSSSNSPSPSPSSSNSPSVSPSSSLSPSSSVSPSLSPSASVSPSSSESASPSPSSPWTDQAKSATPTWTDQAKSATPTWTPVTKSPM